MRRDSMYIFMTLFAGMGGLVLAGSYADHQPIETFNAGTYSLQKYATGAKNTFWLGLNSRLSYCVNATAAPQETVLVAVDNASPQRFALVSGDQNQSCFRPSTNYSRVTVMLPSDLSAANMLTVR